MPVEMHERRFAFLTINLEVLVRLLEESGCLDRIEVPHRNEGGRLEFSGGQIPLPPDARLVDAQLSPHRTIAAADLLLAFESDHLPAGFAWQGHRISQRLTEGDYLDRALKAARLASALVRACRELNPHMAEGARAPWVLDGWTVTVERHAAPGPRITKTPGVCGGDACVRGTRLVVWGLEKWRRLGWDDGRILAAYPQLGPEDLAAAWQYVRDNPEEIERAIRENEAAGGPERA